MPASREPTASDARPFVIDGQLHAVPGPESAESLLSMMKAVGVQAALLAQYSGLGSDNSFILSLVAGHPERFAAVGIIDSQPPAVTEQMAAWKRQPGAVGLRIPILNEDGAARLRAGWYEQELALAERAEIPMFIFCPSELATFRTIAVRHPDLHLVLDHLGLPTLGDEVGPRALARLPDALSLADCKNVAIKISAAPIHSIEAYPYADLWPHLERIIDAYGPDRVIWGSDINRKGGMPYSYADSLCFIAHSSRLTPSDKRLILGDSLRRWIGWNPDVAWPAAW
jgi:predicted TIM-barrel fold metal-dependent hydrolase